MAKGDVTVTFTGPQVEAVIAALALYTAHEPGDGVSYRDNATADRAWGRLVEARGKARKAEEKSK